MAVNSQRTLFVRNIPYKLTSESLEAAFSDFGPIQTCFVVKDPGKETNRGFGYVEFSIKEDAEKAMKETRKIEGRNVSIVLAKKKIKQKKRAKVQGKPKNTLEDDDSDDEHGKDDVEPQSSQHKTEETKKTSPDSGVPQVSEPTDQYQASFLVIIKRFNPTQFVSSVKPCLLKQKNIRKIIYPVVGRDADVAGALFKSKRDAFHACKNINKVKLEGKPLSAMLLQMDLAETRERLINAKKCRLIIRNLSFKINDNILRDKFSQFGDIVEVKIPKKPDGKMLGFGFVQFSSIKSARQALENMNAKPILNRPVAVDWAVSKSEFEKSKDSNDAAGDSGSYSSSGDEEEDEKMDEDDDDSEVSVTSVEDSNSDEDKSDTEVDESSSAESGYSDVDESGNEDKDDSEDDDGTDADEVDGTDSDADEDSSNEEDSDSDEDKRSKRRNTKSDVDQGKTLFIRNLSYDTEEESLMEFFQQFGTLKYGRVVIDPETEHSRGSAFVQFVKKADAEKVLSESVDPNKPLMLDGRKLSVTLALPREKVNKMQTEKKKKPEKDNRNLYLAREGLIRPGTQAAEGLTPADLNKRSKLESTKRIKLKDPNYFISDTRLSVHNIPITTDDAKLRKVFLKAVGDRSARITECRIMRDLGRVIKGQGRSKGYGFVNFTEHRHALKALRETNNNPDLFGEKRRLIVEFSMENRAALAAKEKRLERAKAKQETLAKGKTTFSEVKTKKRNRDSRKTVMTSKDTESGGGDKESQTKKGPKGLPSHWGPKQRHRDRGKNNTKKAQAPKFPKPDTSKRKAPAEPQRPPPKKRAKKAEVKDNVDRLVEKYKSQFTTAYNKGKALSASTSARSKWFDS